MAKIIKVGSQNPTFTSAKTKKANSIQTHRNSNEVTNPFKFTNFEGNTLQFADVFEGFKPNFKANKMRMVATSVTGSMNKMKSTISETVVNFVNRVRTGVTQAWSYAKNTNFTDVPGIKQINDALNAPVNIPGADKVERILKTPVNIPGIDKVEKALNTPIHMPRMSALTSHISELKGNITSRIEFLNRDVLDVTSEMTAKWNDVISKISFTGKQKYTDMTVAELEALLTVALADGGINE